MNLFDCFYDHLIRSILYSFTYLSPLGIVPRAEPGGAKRANTTFCETQVYGEALALLARC